MGDAANVLGWLQNYCNRGIEMNRKQVEKEAMQHNFALVECAGSDSNGNKVRWRLSALLSDGAHSMAGGPTFATLMSVADYLDDRFQNIEDFDC